MHDHHGISCSCGYYVAATTLPQTLSCPLCSETIHVPIKYELWPRGARFLYRRRRDGEIGVGDTFARIAAKFGADRLVAILKRFGLPDCGCNGRRNQWNGTYRYGDR